MVSKSVSTTVTVLHACQFPKFRLSIEGAIINFKTSQHIWWLNAAFWVGQLRYDAGCRPVHAAHIS